MSQFFSVAHKFGDCVVFAILAKQGILNQDQYVTQSEALDLAYFCHHNDPLKNFLPPLPGWLLNIFSISEDVK